MGDTLRIICIVISIVFMGIIGAIAEANGIPLWLIGMCCGFVVFVCFTLAKPLLDRKES